MAAESTTPVKVPKSASSYTPATQDPDLRSQINTLLLKDGHVAKIQDHLLHALHSSPTNWPTLIQTHALTLLRSGKYTTFPELMSKVLEDIRAASKNGHGERGASLALPKNVVEEGIKITRESLEGVCEVVE
ncbi:C Chain C Chaetomium Theromophilum Trex2 Cid Domain Complex protein [Rutstroemia sp. NJR-2017a BVV2]|nr:C Chain C Chaetomium Theromophilum Trex2 Cid Domain Complex protein [Rutstroemia sp. NJR-2017a BVV2]PQE21814.1 C Chain C Chaetomium Theromophilum Trex2 Cid Domain Complex protein [Rutstroemia sp. NJR-2017a BVV2]